MWEYAVLLAFLMLVLYTLTVRQLVLSAVSRVKSREPKTVAEMRFIAHVLTGDYKSVQLNTSKDRSALVGRKHRAQQKAAKAKVAEEQRRKEALNTIREKMGHKLKQRKAKRAKSAHERSTFFFW